MKAQKKFATTVNLKTNEKVPLLDRIEDFVASIYDTTVLKMLAGFISVIIVGALIVGLYQYLKPSDDELTIITTLAEDGKICFSKEWELTPALKKSIERREISLDYIKVIEKGGNITFEGGDSDKIAILDYKTVVEDNNLGIYSDEYFEELKKKGENVCVVRVLGLATEATEKEEGTE